MVGLDVGGTKVRAALATLDGALERVVDHPTPTGDDLLGRLGRIARDVAGEAWPQVAGVGLAVPGAVDPRSGVTRRAQNLPRLETLDLASALGQLLDRRVEVDNDVTAAAAGEAWHRAAPERDDLVVVSLGTGIGAGIVAGGRLLRGHRGAAGEIADLPLAGDATDAAVRRQGVLEHEVGTAGIVRRYLDARTADASHPGAAADADPHAEVVGVRDVLARADAGDAAAAAVLGEVAVEVADAVLAVAAVTDPAVVVLAGGVGAHPWALPAVTAALAERSDAPPRLEVARAGADASLVGAVALAASAAGVTGGR